MTCREHIEKFLCDYLENELPDEKRTEFERHLGLCPECVAFLDCYRKTIEAERKSCCEMKNPELAQIPERLVKAILAARGKC